MRISARFVEDIPYIPEEENMTSDDNDRAEEYLHRCFGQFENDDCDGVIAKFNKSFHFDLNRFISLQATDLHAEII